MCSLLLTARLAVVFTDVFTRFSCSVWTIKGELFLYLRARRAYVIQQMNLSYRFCVWNKLQRKKPWQMRLEEVMRKLWAPAESEITDEPLGIPPMWTFSCVWDGTIGNPCGDGSFPWRSAAPNNYHYYLWPHIYIWELTQKVTLPASGIFHTAQKCEGCNSATVLSSFTSPVLTSLEIIITWTTVLLPFTSSVTT